RTWVAAEPDQVTMPAGNRIMLGRPMQALAGLHMLAQIGQRHAEQPGGGRLRSEVTAASDLLVIARKGKGVLQRHRAGREQPQAADRALLVFRIVEPPR